MYQEKRVFTFADPPRGSPEGSKLQMTIRYQVKIKGVWEEDTALRQVVYLRITKAEMLKNQTKRKNELVSVRTEKLLKATGDIDAMIAELDNQITGLM